jgi:uncharacterized membrane protein (DUF106 family)
MPHFKPKHDHLASYTSFQFALHVAVLAVLIGVFIQLVINIDVGRDTRTKAAPAKYTQN